MNLIVYVWKLNQGDKELLSVMLEKALEQTEFSIVELHDAPKRTNSLPSDVLLCFGMRAFNLISYTYPQAIKLPLLSQLRDSSENQAHRLEAWKILQNIKNLSASTTEDDCLEVSPEDLTRNLTKRSKELIEHIQEDKTKYWIGTTSLGKKVLISQTPNIKIPCSFQITFEELYAAKLAVELLGLTSLTLVKGNKDD